MRVPSMPRQASSTILSHRPHRQSCSLRPFNTPAHTQCRSPNISGMLCDVHVTTHATAMYAGHPSRSIPSGPYASAPACLSMGTNFPSSCRVITPRPSLYPPVLVGHKLRLHQTHNPRQPKSRQGSWEPKVHASAPACLSMGTNLPSLCRVITPGPSLQPPTF